MRELFLHVFHGGVGDDTTSRTARASRRLVQWLGRPETQLLLLSLLFVLVVRLASLRMLSNPDANVKWGFVRDLLHGDPVKAGEFTHHSARWGINLPVIVVQAVFGDRAIVHYVPVLLFSLVQAAFTFEVGKIVAGRWAAVLAVILFSILPAMSYVGSQLMPTVFQSAYVLAALHALLKSRDSDRPRLWIALSCGWFCASYFAYESSVLFLPGLLLGLWALRRRLSDLAIYVGGFTACMALETLAYRLAFGFELGRVTIVKRHHLSHTKLRATVDSLGDLLGRYTELSFGFRELFYVALVVTLVSFALAVFGKRRLEPKLLAVVLTCWGYFFCNTFALKSLSPPRLVQPLNERYLFAGAPLLALVVAWALVTLCNRSGIQWALRWGAVPKAAALFLGVLVYLVPARWKGLAEHTLVRTDRYERLLQSAFEQGHPINSRDPKHNAMIAVRTVFLSWDQVRASGCGEAASKRSYCRVLINADHERYRGLSKSERASKLKGFRKRQHVQVTSLKGGFSARWLHDAAGSGRRSGGPR
jgi:hypothetical protein